MIPLERGVLAILIAALTVSVGLMLVGFPAFP